jgi:hypothetical protein
VEAYIIITTINARAIEQLLIISYKGSTWKRVRLFIILFLEIYSIEGRGLRYSFLTNGLRLRDEIRDDHKKGTDFISISVDCVYFSLPRLKSQQRSISSEKIQYTGIKVLGCPHSKLSPIRIVGSLLGFVIKLAEPE